MHAPMTALKVAQAITALVSTVPTGTILPFAGNTIPEGFLDCNGAAVSRTTYSGLFGVIGTTFGGGDGSTTFNLPNLSDDRFIEFASTAGTQKNAGLPNITGNVWAYARENMAESTGAFINTSGGGVYAYSNPSPSTDLLDLNIILDASESNSIYGASSTVQPKSLTVRAIIKY